MEIKKSTKIILVAFGLMYLATFGTMKAVQYFPKQDQWFYAMLGILLIGIYFAARNELKSPTAKMKSDDS